MTEVARCNGTLLVELGGGRLGVVERGGGWLGTAIFVTLLLAGITASAGVALATQDLAVGLGLLAGAALPALATIALARRRRHLRATPPTRRPWLTFDLGAAVLRDGNDQVLAPLDRVQLARTWQAGSSAKALAVRAGARTLVIARGTPFGDSVDGFEEALVARGLRSEG